MELTVLLCGPNQSTKEGNKKSMPFNWLIFLATQLDQKSNVKMHNLLCKWAFCDGVFYLKLNLLLSAPTVLTVLNPARDLLHISMGNLSLNNSSDWSTNGVALVCAGLLFGVCSTLVSGCRDTTSPLYWVELISARPDSPVFGNASMSNVPQRRLRKQLEEANIVKQFIFT